jgi:hypothetical protein
LPAEAESVPGADPIPPPDGEALAGGFTGGGACGGGAPSPMETLGGPCCCGALEAGWDPVGVAVVDVRPEAVPPWGALLGTGCGGGTVAGAGMPDDGCDPLPGSELGGGTVETGG